MEYTKQIAEIEATLVDAKEKNKEASAKIAKLDAAKKKRAKAAAAAKEKETKAAAAKAKERETKLADLQKAMAADLKRQGELEDLINGVLDKLIDD